MDLKLFVLLSVVLVTSGCLSSLNSDNSPDASSEDLNDVGAQTTNNTGNYTIVKYTNSGFSPETVIINQGDKVRWVSEASNPMWVGSDQHPRHTDYEGSTRDQHCEDSEPVSQNVFDQCSTGNNYTFTFDKTGEWGYHNHRYSTHSGAVIVK